MYYTYRGALNPGRPALLHISGHKRYYIENMSEQLGITSFHKNDTVDRTSLANFPDMEPDGIPLTPSEIEKIPRYVRYMRCNGHECKEEKWGTCDHVEARTSWYTGL